MVLPYTTVSFCTCNRKRKRLPAFYFLVLRIADLILYCILNVVWHHFLTRLNSTFTCKIDAIFVEIFFSSSHFHHLMSIVKCTTFVYFYWNVLQKKFLFVFCNN